MGKCVIDKECCRSRTVSSLSLMWMRLVFGVTVIDPIVSDPIGVALELTFGLLSIQRDRVCRKSGSGSAWSKSLEEAVHDNGITVGISSVEVILHTPWFASGAAENLLRMLRCG